MVAVAKKKSKKGPAAPSVPPVPAADVGGAPMDPLAVIQLDIECIQVDDSLNRTEAPTPESVEELARSMGATGLQHPIGVTLFGANPEPGPGGNCWYRLVWGRRRLEAARLLGWKSISAVVRDFKTEDEFLVDRATENVQRLQMTPVEEAIIVAHILGVYEAQAALGPTAEPSEGEQPNLPVPIAHQVEARKAAVKRAAEYFGKSEQWIRDRGFLARLGKAEQDLVASGRLPLAHAREIAKVADPEVRNELARQAASNPHGSGYHRREYPMPMRELEGLVSSRLLSLSQVPWRLDVAFAGKPACVECPHNSLNNPGLFEHGAKISANPEQARRTWGDRITREPGAGVCTNRGCYAVKSGLAKRAVQTTARRLVKEAKEMPAKSRPDFARPASLSKCTTEIPEYLPKSQVAAAAKEAAKRKASAGDGGAPAVMETQSSKDQARRDAEHALRDALVARSKNIEPMVADALADVPGAWAMFQILRQHALVKKLEGLVDKPAKLAAILEGSEFRKLMEAVCSPSIEGLRLLEKGCGRRYGLFEHWYDGETGFTEAVARALDISVDQELGARPALEDFLPGAKKATPAAAPAKKSKKSRAAAQDDAGDAEDLEPDPMVDDGEDA